MYTLTTMSEKIDNTRARVKWHLSERNCGEILCISPKENENIDIISEMSVIQYLIDKKTILGQKKLSGNDLVLAVSKGAIRKLVLGKSDKKDAQPYASYISTALIGCTLKVHKNKDILSCEEPQTEEIFLNPAIYARYYKLDIENFGELSITRHAVQRFKERTIAESGHCKQPLTSLIKRLSNPELEKVELPPKVVTHKLIKYKNNNDEIELYKHPTSALYFSVLKNKKTGDRILVTVFVR